MLWHQTSHKATKQASETHNGMSETVTYTDSAIVDKIVALFYSKRQYNEILESFVGNPTGTFLFNPMDDETVNSIYLSKTEQFPQYVKRAVIWYLCHGNIGQLADLLRKSLKIQIAPTTEIRFREWSARHEGMPVSAKCQIIGELEEETYTKNATYKCASCNKTYNNYEPPFCENKECTGRRFILDPETLETGDIKTVFVQEPMEEVRNGKPNVKTVELKDDLVFQAHPGQRKMLTGVFRSIPKKNSKRNKIVINAISLSDIEDEQYRMPTPDEKRYFETLAKRADYLKTITDSYAPQIKFREMEKMAVILSRIGANQNDINRGRIHSLLIGAPGTAKTMILKFLPKVTQRCGFTVGGMSTGAGITVVMSETPDRKKFPKGGLLVQCSDSIVAIDELNQMSDEDKEKTYSCMETGEIPYDKAGFHQVFQAETAIVAGANPKDGIYMPERGMIKNIGLPYPMITRFDIKVNVMPEQSQTESQQITDHTDMIRKTGIAKYLEEHDLLQEDELLKLFNLAKSISVTKSPEAKKEIDTYVSTMMQLQTSGQQEEGVPQFDRRFAESITRIAESFAKLHLQETITKEHAEMAIDYIKKTLETFGVRTELGQTQVTMEDTDKKDKDVAGQKLWLQMCKDADTDRLPKDDFVKFMVDQRPDIFDEKRAYAWFDRKHEMGMFEYSNGRYKMVK